MKKAIARMAAIFLSAVLLSAGLAQAAPISSEGTKQATILFTHDMHSHLLPAPKEGGGQFGGFARLKTLLDQERAAATIRGIGVLTVDGGDFSMGALFQAIYTTHATELRSLGAMGFDATTLGNHEFEYRGEGLAQMLNAAMGSGEALPYIVQANYTTPTASSPGVVNAMEDYGIVPYTMIEKEGVRFAVFGLMGKDADDTAPLSGMVHEPIIDAAKRVVEEIQKNEDYDFIICLSHSGTNKNPKNSEDELLAKAVDGIDFIVSGHTHTLLAQPIIINNTIIGSVGEYANNLGAITIAKDASGKNSVVDYRLIPVSEKVKEDPTMAAAVAEYKTLVEQNYLAQFGMTYDQVLAQTAFDFTPSSRFAQRQEEDSLGSLVADAYIYAVEQVEKGKNAPPITAAFTNSGVIRATFPKGDITVSNAFDVSSIGSGADGTPGYPLIDVWLTGAELKNVMEVDPSVGAIYPAAQLYSSGVRYDFNMNRMIFNRMTNPALLNADGTQSPIEDDKLYRVVTNLYSSQMLGLITEKSFGILKVTPKDAQGNPITDYEAHIIHMPGGGELKEWYALATYLQSFPKENGVSQVPEHYAGPEGRKVRIDSLNPIALLKNPNWVTLLVLAIILLVVAVVILVVSRIRNRSRNRRKGSRRTKGYHSYRG